MSILSASRDDLAEIKSKAEYISDIMLSYLSALDSDTPADEIPPWVAADVRQQLENIADTLDPYCFPDEED